MPAEDADRGSSLCRRLVVIGGFNLCRSHCSQNHQRLFLGFLLLVHNCTSSSIYLVSCHPGVFTLCILDEHLARHVSFFSLFAVDNGHQSPSVFVHNIFPDFLGPRRCFGLSCFGRRERDPRSLLRLRRRCNRRCRFSLSSDRTHTINQDRDIVVVIRRGRRHPCCCRLRRHRLYGICNRPKSNNVFGSSTNYMVGWSLVAEPYNRFVSMSVYQQKSNM